MKKFFTLFILFALILSGCGNKDESVRLEKNLPAYQLAKDIAVKIPFLDPDKNNVLISTKEFDVTAGEVIQTLYDNLGARTNQLPAMDANRLKTIIVQNSQRIAEQKLVLGAAKNAKFTVPQAIEDSILNVQYNRAGGEKNFIEMLEKNGVKLEAIQKQFKKEIAIDKFLEMVLDTLLQTTEDEIKKAYDEYTSKEIATVRHILLLTRGKNDTEKKQIHKKMEQILAEVKKGADFIDLVKKYSEDPGSKNNGGLYENFTRGAMVKPFEDAAFTVPVGQVSNIVETVYGYHILKVIARNNFKLIEEYRPELEKQIRMKKRSEVFQAYMMKLKADVDYKKIEF